MRTFLSSFLPVAFLYTVHGAAHSAVKGVGSTTRGWSCCKNSCSWSNKAPVTSPVISCDNMDNLGVIPARRDGCDSGGGSFACSDLSPWAKNNDLAYGYAGVNLAASNETSWCCSCYSLTFTSGPVNGKQMIVQVVNTGADLGDDQFDLAIPGAGQGDMGGCTKQFGGDVWGAAYGGVAHREDCDALPDPLKAGCYWRFDWFRNADNPSVSWEKTSCPQDLSYVSGCRRNDDPLPGQSSTSKPPPTSTKSAPIASGTVQNGGQCGGRNYRGPTVCVPGTVCTFSTEDAYYCRPDPASTRTTPTITTPTAKPTAALPWEQCGGRDYTGPIKCKDSSCVSINLQYWQCQPSSGYVPPASSAPPVVSNNPGLPMWSFTRPHRTWPGQGQPPVQTAPPQTRPGSPTTPTKPPTPAPTIAQLYEQCGGKTYQGPTRCVQGLNCVFVDDYYSQCQKPARKANL